MSKEQHSCHQTVDCSIEDKTSQLIDQSTAGMLVESSPRHLFPFLGIKLRGGDLVFYQITYLYKPNLLRNVD